MSFKKGRTKTGGRKKGTPNKVTWELRENISRLIGNQFAQIERDIAKLEPKERVNAWIRLLEYSLPKLQRSENLIDLNSLTESELDEIFEKIVSKINVNS